MKETLYQLAMSLTPILREYLKGKTVETDFIKRVVFVESWRANQHLPDYVHKSHIKESIEKSKTVSSLILDSYKALTKKYLYFRKEKVYVHSVFFESWQNMLTRLSPLPLISFAIFQEFHKPKSGNEDALRVIQTNLSKSTLPSMFEPFINSIVEREGLRDLHLHLNGTTEMDMVWQDALENPAGLYEYIKESSDREYVREQYLQMDDYIEESMIYRMLCIARVLRDLMTRNIFKGNSIESSKLLATLNTQRLCTNNYLTLEAHNAHPIQSVFPGAKKLTGPECEALFLVHAFGRLKEEKDTLFAHCLHCYLLLLSYFNKLLVQQLSQKGFDQFQKITMNELRSISEQSYYNRYRQLEGMHGDDMAFLEGRFSPKETPKKNHALLSKIITGFEKYRKDKGPVKHRVSLKLISHFIKERDNKTFCLCRHYHLRTKNSLKARALMALLREKPYLREYVTGVDAAANELETPPEVYAPIYGDFRREGFTDFTFHVGEDYRHLISGIRAVYEAVLFLGLGKKNRVGHATAIGIPPSLWIQKSPPEVVLEKGEWLDTLVFSHMLLSEESAFSRTVSRIREEISFLHREIFHENGPQDISLLVRAWELRRLDPLIAFDPTLERSDLILSNDRARWDEIEKAEKRNPAAFRLFKLHHSKETVKRYKERITVKSDFPGPEEISFLQRKTIQMINKRGVAIETMPTSNVRISFYKRYEEHHMFRWLGLKDKGGLPEPVLCVCTDDPGIFATNLRNEYAHIYQTLMESFGMSRREAFGELQKLTENSRIYGFED